MVTIQNNKTALSQIKRLVVVMCFSLLSCPAWAVDFNAVTLNGVTSGRAVLTIDGQYTVINQGDTKQGVTLVDVTPNDVLVSYKGRHKRLSLSVVSQLSSKLSKSGSPVVSNAHPLSSQGTHLNQANSHIISVAPILREPHKTTFRVTYFYNGNYGEHAQLRARVRLKGHDTGFSSHSYVRLDTGRNQADITIMMNRNAPDAFYSDEVFFDVLGSKPVANSYLVLAQSFPFTRQWQKPSKQEPNFVLSNTTQWQTGKR